MIWSDLCCIFSRHGICHFTVWNYCTTNVPPLHRAPDFRDSKGLSSSSVSSSSFSSSTEITAAAWPMAWRAATMGCQDFIGQLQSAMIFDHFAGHTKFQLFHVFPVAPSSLEVNHFKPGLFGTTKASNRTHNIQKQNVTE